MAGAGDATGLCRTAVFLVAAQGGWRQREELVMPLIQVKVIENVFSDAQKQEIVRRLTDAMVEIEGENMRPVTWCIVDEVRSGDWGIAGSPLTTSDVKALAAGVGV
jgi:4-oxalocrotonate tautomerase